MGQGLARQEAAGEVFGWFWNLTEVFFQSKTGPLAGYPDSLWTLLVSQSTIYCVDCFIKESKTIVSDSQMTPRNIKSITQHSDRIISIKHHLNGIYQICYLVRGSKCRETQFVNTTMKLSALHVCGNGLGLARGEVLQTGPGNLPVVRVWTTQLVPICPGPIH